MDSIIQALSSGLPILVFQLGVASVLLALGVVGYMAVTPYDEMRLVREGNVAAGLTMFGAVVALAIPIGATLATSHVALDIVVWGLVAIALQLVAFIIASRLFRGLRGLIEGGNVAVALVLVGVQLGVALLNAAAVSG